MTVRWFGAQRKADLIAAVQDALGAMATNFVLTMKNVVSKKGTGRLYPRPTRMHQASAPGMPPALDSGHYTRSIQADLSQQRTPAMKVSVGTPIKYGPWLEFGRGNIAPRPHWIPTLREQKEKLKGLAQRVVAKRLKAVK